MKSSLTIDGRRVRNCLGVVRDQHDPVRHHLMATNNYSGTKTLLLYLVLLFGSAVFILPLVWMERSAIMDSSQIFIVPPSGLGITRPNGSC